MAISTFKRYEKKYLLYEEQYQSMIQMINNYMRPDKFCKDGSYYSIHNIYYDTYDSQIIRHSISKPYYKEKLRLRSYGVLQSEDETVYLELKKKIGGVVNKRRAQMTFHDAEDFISNGIRKKYDFYINEQVLNEISFFIKTYKVVPAVYIGYERNAYFGIENKDFRITFDKNITTRRDNLSLLYGFQGTQLLEKGLYLMEVKIEGAIPLWLATILSDLKIFSTSFSKYGKEYEVYNQTKERRVV